VSQPNSTTLSPAAQALGVKNRLSRDLDELQKAAAGAMTLAPDADGHLFDLGCHLHGALQSLENALQAIERYRIAERAAKLEVARQVADQFNAELFAN